MTHTPHARNVTVRSGASHFPRTSARMPITTPIRIGMLPQRADLLRFISFCHLSFLSKTKKEARYPYPFHTETFWVSCLFALAGHYSGRFSRSPLTIFTVAASRGFGLLVDHSFGRNDQSMSLTLSSLSRVTPSGLTQFANSR